MHKRKVLNVNIYFVAQWYARSLLAIQVLLYRYVSFFEILTLFSCCNSFIVSITGQCGGGRNYLYGNEPEFTEPLKNITVQMGRNATFTCHISGIENKGFRVSML